MLNKITIRQIRDRVKVSPLLLGLVAGLALFKPAENMLDKSGQYAENYLKHVIRQVLQEESKKGNGEHNNIPTVTFNGGKYTATTVGSERRPETIDIKSPKQVAEINVTEKPKITQENLSSEQIEYMFLENLLPSNVPLKAYTKERIHNIFDRWDTLPKKAKEALVKITNSYIPALEELRKLDEKAQAKRKEIENVGGQLIDCYDNGGCNSREQLVEISRQLNADSYELSKKISSLRAKAYSLNKEIKKVLAHHMSFEDYFAITYATDIMIYYASYKEVPSWKTSKHNAFKEFEDSLGIPLKDLYVRDALVEYLWMHGIHIAEKAETEDGAYVEWFVHYAGEAEFNIKLLNFLKKNEELFATSGINTEILLKAQK